MRKFPARFVTALATTTIVGSFAPLAQAAQVGPLEDWECTVTPTDAEVATVSQMYVHHNQARELYEAAYLNGYDAIYPGTRKVIEEAWADPAVIAAVDEFLEADEADVFELSARALEKNRSLTDEYAKRLATETGMPEDIADEVAHFFSAYRVDVLTDRRIAGELSASSYAPDVSAPVILSTPPDATLTDQAVGPDRDAMLAHAKQRAKKQRSQTTLATSTWTFAPSFLSLEQKQLFDAAAFTAPGLEDFYADEHTLKIVDTQLRIACLEGGNAQVTLPTSYRFGGQQQGRPKTRQEALTEEGAQAPSKQSETAPPQDEEQSSKPVLGIVLGVIAALAAGIGALVYFAPHLGLDLPF